MHCTKPCGSGKFIYKKFCRYPPCLSNDNNNNNIFETHRGVCNDFECTADGRKPGQLFTVDDELCKTDCMKSDSDEQNSHKYFCKTLKSNQNKLCKPSQLGTFSAWHKNNICQENCQFLYTRKCIYPPCNPKLPLEKFQGSCQTGKCLSAEWSSWSDWDNRACQIRKKSQKFDPELHFVSSRSRECLRGGKYFAEGFCGPGRALEFEVCGGTIGTEGKKFDFNMGRFVVDDENWVLKWVRDFY